MKTPIFLSVDSPYFRRPVECLVFRDIYSRNDLMVIRGAMLILLLANLVVSYTQDTIVMPQTGNGGFYNTCYAVIFDDGVDSNYANYANATVTIAPLWVENVSLYFQEFNTEIFFDSLSMYDGPGTTFPLIGTYSGNELQGQTVYSTGNSITLAFHSDDVVTGTGFVAWVGCTLGNENIGHNGVSVYPNPASVYLSIHGIEANMVESISIMDAAGRCIHTSASLSVHVETWAPGLYGLLVRLKNGEVLYKKWIKA